MSSPAPTRVASAFVGRPFRLAFSQLKRTRFSLENACIQWCMNFFAYLIAVAAGAANPLQAGANAELNKQISSPLWAGIFVYASGLLSLLLAELVLRHALPRNRADRRGKDVGVAGRIDQHWLHARWSDAGAEARIRSLYRAHRDCIDCDFGSTRPVGMGGISSAHRVAGASGRVCVNGGRALDGGEVLR